MDHTIADPVDVQAELAPLTDEPTTDEVKFGLRKMANGQIVGPDDPPAELLKLGLREESTILQSCHVIVTIVW